MATGFLNANFNGQLLVGVKTIYFATTSKVKFDQYRMIFNELGIDLKRGTAITSVLVEPQHDASNTQGELLIVGHPLRQAARFVQRSNQIPYMIEDTMLLIDAFSAINAGSSGLPGADTKNWWRNLGAEGVLKLLEGNDNREARFICQIGVYLGNSQYKFVRSETTGSITERIRVSALAETEVPRSNPFFFHSIFQPTGWGLSLGEMGANDFQRVDYRQRCARKLILEITEFLQIDSQLRLPFDW